MYKHINTSVFGLFRGKMDEIDTQALLRRVNDGDSFAYELLAEKYGALVERAARSAARYLEEMSTLTEFSLEDLKQEAQLALYRAAKSYDAEKVSDNVTFGLYAKICIRNAMTSQIRRANSKRRRSEKAALESSLLIDGDNVGDFFEHYGGTVVQNRSKGEILSDCEKLLSGYERDVFILYMQGKSNFEISRLTGRDTKSVSNALYRIKVKLKGLSK